MWATWTLLGTGQTSAGGSIVRGRETELSRSGQTVAMCVRSQHNVNLLSCHDDASDELKQLCEGGCSLSDIEAKRRDFTKELAEMRTTAEVIPLSLQLSFPPSSSLPLFLVCHLLQCEQSACSLALRNTPLGEDRYGRTFWHLQVRVLCSV